MPLLCRYPDFVEQHQDTDSHADNGRIMGSASLDGAEERQKQVFFASHRSVGIKILWSNTKTLTLKLTMAASWAAHLWMVLKTSKKQV